MFARGVGGRVWPKTWNRRRKSDLDSEGELDFGPVLVKQIPAPHWNNGEWNNGETGRAWKSQWKQRLQKASISTGFGPGHQISIWS
jgi:hypothetical protein